MKIITYTRTNYYYYYSFKWAAKNKDLSKALFVFYSKIFVLFSLRVYFGCETTLGF